MPLRMRCQLNLFEAQFAGSSRGDIAEESMICDLRLGKGLQSGGLVDRFQAAFHVRRHADLIRD